MRMMMRRPRGLQYYQRVLNTASIAYWPLDDASGTVARELVAGLNGVHTGITLGQPGIGDGRTCPLYDGSTSFTNIYSAGLASAFSGAAGSLMAWARVSAAGVWTDATIRSVVILQADSSNYLYITKTATSNQINLRYRAGGTTTQVNADVSSIGWTNYALTWNKSGDAVAAFVNGVQVGTTQTSLGTWAGSLTDGACNIGALNTTPSSVWSGLIGPVAVWDRAITPGEIGALARF